MLARLRGQGGLTLIETLVAILIFSIVTIGVVPLLATALRGSEISQTSAVAKNLAVEAMERARGLPYFISEARNAGDVDLLDLYYPDQPNSGDSYLTTCGPDDASPACPEGGVPAGHTVSYLASFVNTDATAEVDPPTTYDAHPDTSGESDSPPTNLLRLQVTVAWDVFGRPRTFDLESLFGRHGFGDDDLRGSAVVDYVVRVETNFPSIPEAEVTVTGGSVDSRINSRSLSIAASQRVDAVRMESVPDGGEPTIEQGTTAALEEPSETGGTSSVRDPLPLSILGIGEVADAEQASLSASPAAATTAVDLDSSPEYARGGFTFPSTTTAGNIWVDKPDATRGSGLQLAASPAKLVSVRGSSTSPLSGYTSVSAAAPGGTGLTSTAGFTLDDLRLFPTTFAPTGVVRVTGLTANVSCNSNTVGALAEPTATYGPATVTVSVDLQEDTSGTGTRSTVTRSLSSSSTTDPLATLGPVPAGSVTGARDPRNPMIYEDPNEPVATTAQSSSPGDTYLFPQEHLHPATRTTPAISHSHAGYLDSWQSRVGVSTRIGGETDPASASIGEVLGINTVGLPTATGTTQPLFLSVGSLSCEALDQR